MNMIDMMEKSFAQVVCAGVAILAASLAQGKTVAYWPMVMDPATGGETRTIADASGNEYEYTLKVNLNDEEAVNTEDGSFSRPPNGPADVTASSCVEISNGTSLIKAPFERGEGNQSQTIDPLILAMGLRHDFTIEGYMYVKSLKHTVNDRDTIIAFSGMNGTGDWTWYMLEPEKDSNTRKVIVYPRRHDIGAVENSGVLAVIDDSEILGGWHHYALVFKFNEANGKSRWTFYLDGVNRGSQLMPNREENQNVQHDRFQLGGANSSAKKVCDAKFAFWRVSDEALSANSLLCHQTFDTTVAYWPMNVVTSFYNNASQPIVRDVVDARNTLMVRDPSKGGVSWTGNDIGWTTPPNPDADVAEVVADWQSKMMVRSGNNTTLIGNQYKPVFSTVANAPVIEATMLNKSFTIEGFLKCTALPAEKNANQMFVYNTLGERGGWCWNLHGADENGFLSMRVSHGFGGSTRDTLILCKTLRAEELLNVWNHYALTFTPDNGRGTTEWRFYFNGRLLGMSTAMGACGDYSFTSPSFYMSGAASGANPQALLGDMTCWRVSNKVLIPPEFLCGGEPPPSPHVGALIWKGAADSAEWSTGDALNWIADGSPSPVSWSDAKDVYFDDNYATNCVEIAGAVNPASINVIANSDMRLDFNNVRSSAIGDGCTNFVKHGFGTFEIYSTNNTTTALLNGARPIEVREGTLKVNAVNSNGALGDASCGYEVKVYGHATLSLYARNVIGNGSPDVANDSVFTVYTNGTFNMSSGNNFNIQALGTLDLLGGNFVAPARCHGLGYLLIRNRLTLGCNPGKRPYVFPAVLDQYGTYTNHVGITFGYNTEFRVEDVTGDSAADGIFNCALLARTAWQKEHPCGFRKTGGGTMELNNPSLGSGGTQVNPTGVIAVEAGELRVNIDYSNASKYTVADGAFLSGTGKVSKVEFSAGAGMRVDATKADILELARADFAGDGVVELSGVLPEDVANLRVNCAKVGGQVMGTANLSDWKVKVDGEELPRVAVRMHGGFLRARVVKGMVLVFK